MVAVDLDKSGNPYHRTKINLGPTLGVVELPLIPTATVTTGGTTTIAPGDSVVLVDVAAAVTINLPDVTEWVKQSTGRPATGFERALWVKDIGGNAGTFNITVHPFSGQRIDKSLSDVAVNVNFQLLRLYPLFDLSGWYIESGVLTVSSGANITFLQAGTGAVLRTMQDKARDFVSLKDFGAVGDGSADDTTAITNWLAALTNGKSGLIPAGTYKFTSALSKTDGFSFSIVGMGGQESTLLYAGANTTNDIITIGDGVSQVTGVYLSGFRVDSSTTMTGGNGVRLKQLCRSALNNVVVGGQDGNNKLFDGLFFDQADQVIWNGFDVKTLNDGVKVRGGAAGPRANILMLQGKIVQCGRFGLVLGGGFGGFYAEAADIIANTNHNVVIDQSLVASPNRELFFGPGCFMDSSATGSGIHLNNGMVANGLLQLTGTWVSGNALQGINVTATEVAASRIQINGGTIFSNGQDGLRVSAVGPTITSEGTLYRNNSGWGINVAAAGADVRVGINFFIANASGEVTGVSWLTTNGGLTLNAGGYTGSRIVTASGSQTFNSLTGTRIAAVGGGGIPQLLNLTYTDNSTSVTGELSNQVVRFVYTWNGATPSTAFDAMFDFSPIIQQNLGTLVGINLEGPVVSAGKTLGIYKAIDIGPPSGAGTVTSKTAINIQAGAGSLTTADQIRATSPTAGIGYGTGAGGAVTQLTSRATGVILNTVSGDITLFSAAGSATANSFTVTNSAVVATDTISINQKSGTDLYNILITNVGAGSFKVTFFTTGGTTTEQPVFHFNVIKGVNA